MFSAKEVIALCTFLVFAHVTSAAKIACFPFWGGSHYNLMRNVAEELASRGHEVGMNVSVFSAVCEKPPDVLTQTVGKFVSLI